MTEDLYDLHFVGAMHPDMFMDKFMTVADLPAAPAVNYAGVPIGDNVRELCGRLIQVVERSNVCPGMRLFAAKTTKRRAFQERPRAQRDSWRDSSGEFSQEAPSSWPYPCPAMAVRTQPKFRRKMKRRDIVEYYNFSTTLLDIEVDCRPEADPFLDSAGSTSSRVASAAAPSRSSLTRPGAPQERSASISRCQTPPAIEQQATYAPSVRKSLPPRSPTEAPDRVKSDELEPAVGSLPAPRVSPSAEAGPSRLPRDGSPVSGALSCYEPFPSSSEEGMAFRASMVSHAIALFARQHRTFCFQLVIIDRWARFIRWDRSGAVGTRRFDYVLQPQLLSEFFWRFAHMTNEERGFDSSAKLASKQETALFNAAVREFVKDMKAGTKDGKPVRRLPNAECTLDDTGTYPAWKIHVVDAVTRKSTDLVVGRPFSEPSDMFGRCTRAYIAFDLMERRLVFLKDAWRLDNPCLRAESKTYRELQRHGVSHVPEMLYGGDVRGTSKTTQHTLTQVYATDEDSWRITEGDLHSLVHHRIVQDIAYPLESVLHDQEFVQVMHGASLAIADAYYKAGLLHRDISFGNIMVTPRGEGILNDWDHAGHKDDLTRGIGTWAFMSISLLTDHRRIHSVSDDEESFFWVFVYVAFKYFRQKPNPGLLHSMFAGQYSSREARQDTGRMRRALLDESLLSTASLSSALIQSLVRELRSCWFRYYLAKDNPVFLAQAGEARDMVFCMLDQAHDPHFWADKLSAALQAQASEVAPLVNLAEHEAGAETDSSGSIEVSQCPSATASQHHGMVLRTNRKRKASEQPDAGATTEASTQIPRRSKRLRRLLP